MTDFIFKQLINGEWVDASDGGAWELINPATEDVIAEIPFGGADDANAALDAAAAAFPAWSKKTAFERAAVLHKAAAWIRERIDALGAISTEESGKPMRESTAEWQGAANGFEWCAELAKHNVGQVVQSRNPARRLLTIYQPMGVVGTITAWNFPVYNVVRAWAAALAAGNTVVGRPSEYTPRSAMLLAQALHEAGIPKGVVNVINGEPSAMGEAMLKDARCRKIQFTGSTRVGKLLMDGASQTITRLSLELGGNAPVLIFPDVNVEATAKAAIAAKYRNCGQVCISPQRFFVHSRIAEEFIDHTSRMAQGLKLGSGLEATTDVGPMINATQRERLEKIINTSVQSGAQVLAGGSRPSDPGRGYFYNPTVITNLTPDMPAYREELFGPVMPIIPFDDVDEALALANATEYGLAAYVQTRDMNTAIRMYEGLEFGMVAVNDWLPSTPEMPFGGIKGSGMGREYGEGALHEYMETKSVFLGGIPT